MTHEPDPHPQVGLVPSEREDDMTVEMIRGDVDEAGEPCTYCGDEGRVVEAATEVPIEPIDPLDPEGPRIATFVTCCACVSAVLADEQTRDGDPLVIVVPGAESPEGVYTASPWP